MAEELYNGVIHPLALTLSRIYLFFSNFFTLPTLLPINLNSYYNAYKL